MRVSKSAHIKSTNNKYIFVSSDGYEHPLTKMEIMMYNIGVLNLVQLEKQYNNQPQKG